MSELLNECSYVLNMFVFLFVIVTIASSIIYLLISPTPYSVILKILEIDVVISAVMLFFVLLYYNIARFDLIAILFLVSLFTLLLIKYLPNPFAVYPLLLFILIFIDVLSEAPILPIVFLLFVVLLMLLALTGKFLPVKRIYVMFPTEGFAVSLAISLLPILMLLRLKLSY